jgi:hypothetical protein
LEELTKQCQDFKTKAENNEAANLILNGFLQKGMA